VEVDTAVKGYIPLGIGGIEVDIFALELIHPLLLHLMISTDASFSLAIQSSMGLYDHDRDPELGGQVVILVEVWNLVLGNP